MNASQNDRKSYEVDRVVTYQPVISDVGNQGDAPPSGSATGISSAPKESTALEKEDLVKAYRYGKTMVPIAPVDEEMMKLESEKSLLILGFYTMKAVPRSHFMSNVLTVIPAPDDPASIGQFCALVGSLVNTQSVAIARYCRINNADPKLGILWPSIKFQEGESAEKYRCLYFMQTPFAEDVRLYSFPALPLGTSADIRVSAALKKLAPSPEQLEIAENLINSFNLSNSGLGEGG
jgi:ATP-dependent DNA helicase 2 subunit 2